MNKKFIAIIAVMMVLTGSFAFAANNSNRQMPMMNNQYAQHNVYHDQYGRHGQHMFRLTDQAKCNSTSMWDSVCNFFGMHGGHGSHSRFGSRYDRDGGRRM
ncbi:hypothetical protein ACQ0P8_11160 [Halodesulfovibrio aestuarii]|uniref:Uncharacterized protein n=1 Tax=Halodesulfovibrio aestuarii TaxID=126333 RepID=A0A8G2CAR2_9BACT|nr:hypothetical protein [Halodesulfovibrio aestuarii]SHJ37951.1 hypothetical protein SAMN05660830_02296 [Halodesulfovibrio aestuarii]